MAVLSILILITIALVHSDHGATAAIAMSIFSIGVAACVVLIAAHNRPFTGEIAVGPQLLIQERPKEELKSLLGLGERRRAGVVGLSAIARASGFGDARRHPSLLAVLAFLDELEHRCFGEQAR